MDDLSILQIFAGDSARVPGRYCGQWQRRRCRLPPCWGGRGPCAAFSPDIFINNSFSFFSNAVLVFAPDAGNLPRTRTLYKPRHRTRSSQAGVRCRSPTVSGLHTTGRNHPEYHRDRIPHGPAPPRTREGGLKNTRPLCGGCRCIKRAAKVLPVPLAAVPALEPYPW